MDMEKAALHAKLHLNDREVGAVEIKGSDNSWGYGEFRPLPTFAEFAPIFGRWSILMHADEDAEKLSAAASEELRQAEYAMDKLRAKLFLEEVGEWRGVTQGDKDGSLIGGEEREGGKRSARTNNFFLSQNPRPHLAPP